MPNEHAGDGYPTRRGGPSVALPRRDPVVYGGVDDGPLDAETMHRYGDDGFLVVRGLLDEAEVAACRREVRRLATAADLRGDERLVPEPDSAELRSVFAVHRLSPVFATLCAAEKLVAPARQLLGSAVYLHQTRVNCKPGFRGRDFYWHSDFETWHAEDGMPRIRALTVCVALTDNHAHNGPLLLMPGSHRTFVTGRGSTPGANFRTSLKDQTVGVPDEDAMRTLAAAHRITAFTGRAGDAVVFDSNCMHGSNGNITPDPRMNLFVVFNSVHNTLVEPFAAAAPRPEFLGSRDFTPVGPVPVG
ncbi:ectoine hydroxylase [Virgisporangium aurantiacum]|uniref:Ectoine hydroxylase n=1 Tax=Virgisporangium aurantiacum TaxID=175570 RepID=A0A8J3ZIN8_9ACTN|nr:ectoine hydroxylase [Virgisporangium aurantiacum]GIJ62241.1 ectoine hydroxylase [Virgisporangium aurantiacum]